MGRAGEEGGEKERVLLQVLYLEITQGGKELQPHLSCFKIFLGAFTFSFASIFFFFFFQGEGVEKKKKKLSQKNFEGLILASIQTDVACHSVVKQAADWSKQQQFRGNCSRTGKWEI